MIHGLYKAKYMNDYYFYMLGFIWADGCVRYKKSKYKLKDGTEKTYLSYQITIEIVKEDMDILYDNCFNKDLFKMRLSNRKRKHWKEQSTLNILDKKFFDFLKENDYMIKSSVEPNKILSIIPDEKKYLWWRGYSDGDGCFYISKDWYNTHFTVAGPYNNTNSCFIDLLKEQLSIPDKNIEIKKHIRKSGSYSSVRLHNRIDCYLWGKYIYQNFENENIGLHRKHHKYIMIKEKLGL